MPNYVWTVKDRYGDRLVKEVVAGTAEEAKAQLLAQGCTELELVESEIADAINAGRTAPRVFGEAVKVTAAERLKHYNTPAKNFWSVLCEGIAHSKGFCIGIPLLALYQVYLRNYLSALLCVVGLLAWLAFLITNGLPSIYFRKLVKALDWQRWAEVVTLVDKLEQINRFHYTKAPSFFLIRSRAQALAATGRLPEAIALFAPCEYQPGCPGWMHKMLLAGIYGTARQYDQAIEYTRLSLAEKPTSAGWLDVANRFARYKKDPVQARAAMVEAEKFTITSNEEAYRLRCRGIIAWVAGDYPAAQKELEASLAIMTKTPHVPYRDGHISIAKAYLGCALARLGDLPAAQKCFAEAKPYLVATDETELIKECAQALGESRL